VGGKERKEGTEGGLFMHVQGLAAGIRLADHVGDKFLEIWRVILLMVSYTNPSLYVMRGI
jgi:hypothetical protein